MIKRLTINACLTNFNGTYLIFPVLLIGTLIALVAPDGGDHLYRIALLNAAYFGLVSGTTMVEIKVKPLSWCMPGQEKSMGPAIILCAAIVCLLYAALLWLKPMSSVDIPVVQQVLTVFLWSFGVYLVVVISAVTMRDSMINSFLLTMSFFLLVAGIAHPGVAAAWLSATAMLAGSPVLAIGFAGAAATLTARTLANRELSRTLCGSPFMPLGGYDNPLKMDEYRKRMRRTSFRPSSLTSRTGPPWSKLLVKLSQRAAGSSWDFALMESRLSGNVAELFGKLLYLGLTMAFVSILWSQQDDQSNMPPIAGLFLMVAMSFIFFAPSFKARLSPMLPVSRRQHFRSLLTKSAFVYLVAVISVLAFQLLVKSLLPIIPALAGTGLSLMAEAPFKGVLIVAINVPVFCWAFTVIRSTAAFLIFFILYTGIVMNVVLAASDTLLALSFPGLLLITGVCWLPFLSVAWRRCFRGDLLRL